MRAMKAVLTAIFPLAALGCVQVTSGKYFSLDEAESIPEASAREAAARRLGEPALRETLGSDVEVWVYQYTQVARGLLGEEVATNHLTLRFEGGILRDWSLKRYLGAPRDGTVLPPDPRLARGARAPLPEESYDLVEVIYYPSREDR